MAFISTISPRDAQGDVRAMYERQQMKYGFVPNYAKVFCHRPELMALWASLLAGIRRHIEPRRFELVTVAAAHGLRSSYCSLAHGRALTKFLPAEQVRGVAAEHDATALSPADAAVAAFARKVAVDAAGITAEDVAGLRRHGFTDAQIFDIAATAAGRSFFAKLLDALGVEPDSVFLDLEENLRHALTPGRPIDSAAPERFVETG